MYQLSPDIIFKTKSFFDNRGYLYVYQRALQQLNNDYLGVGYSVGMLTSGVDKISLSTILGNFNLVFDVMSQNGSWQFSNAMKEAGRQSQIDPFEAQEEAWIAQQSMAHQERMQA